MIDIKKCSYEELIKEWDKSQLDWGGWSCDCFGFYIKELHYEIVKRGGWSQKIIHNHFKKKI